MKVKVTMSLVLLGFVAFVSWLVPFEAGATSGVCANCHVMHDSEQGVSVSAGPTFQGNDQLLRGDCLSCHTQGNGFGAPYVYSSALPLNTLAGGNFYYSNDTSILPDDPISRRKGHNPYELTQSVDPTFLDFPPGWDPSFLANGQVGVDFDNSTADKQLSCAGVYGCHGEHTVTSMKGSHHKNKTGVDITGLSLGASFRFLKGIRGWESATYGLNDVVPNVYYGINRTGDVATDAEATFTMSYFCAECHGVFHSGANDAGTDHAASFASPWIRHPVDYEMPKGTTEYNAYVYTGAVPVATSRLVVSGGGSAVPDGVIVAANVTDRIVMCLSCHRAHASPNDAALRWNPADVSAGSGVNPTTGCFACHTTKDDV